MTTRLTVIDEETRTELAELGMETRVRRVLCRDCRFRIPVWEGPDECIVNGNRWTQGANPNGECEKFEPRPLSKPSAALGAVALVAFGIVIGFTLGLVVSL